MDDVAKRREARRRKILENSSDRLKKITGIEEKSIKVPPSNECPSNHLNENQLIVENYEGNELIVENHELNEFQPFNSKDNITNESEQPQKQYRVTVIIAMAIFVHFQLLLVEKLLKVDLDSLHLNKIFIPVLLYEIIYFFMFHKHRTENKNFLYSVIVASTRNNQILPLIRNFELIANVLQDVMIYFFAYVCCDIVKYITWPLC